MPENIEVGDIIIELDGDSADHSLMWVGGEKSIVHSAEADDFVGVIQQSARPYTKWKSDDKDWKPYALVYRSEDGLGDLAAKFALQWATRSDNETLSRTEKAGERKVRNSSPIVTRRRPYQKKFGGLPIPPETLSMISKSNQLLGLKRDEGAANLITDALKGIDPSFVPKGMLVDAKTTSASNLMEQMNKGDSGSPFVATSLPHRASSSQVRGVI